MKLYVIRHGRTNCNDEHKYNGRLDEDINEVGMKQAQEAREKVKVLDIDFIICSPLLRTKHTCEIVNANGVSVMYDDRIAERDTGMLTGKELGEFYDTDYWNYYSNKKIEGLETIPELLNRVKLFLDEIRVKYADKNILLVTHGGVARAIYYYFHPLPADGMLNGFNTKNCEIKEYILTQK